MNRWKYLGIAILALLLFVGYNTHISSVKKVSYAQGFSSANDQWEKKGKEYVALIDKGLADNAALNDQLAIVSEQKRIAESKKVSGTVTKQIEYSTAPSATRKDFDEKFIDLYNYSLGE